MNLGSYCETLARQAKSASRILSTSRGEVKNAWLTKSAQALEKRMPEILDANQKDVDAASGLTSAQVERLKLSPGRIAAMAQGLGEIAALPDPIGKVLDSSVRPNGLQIVKVGVPLGVIFFIYESRPNVTVDAAGLCVKAGNAIILRGGKEALHSNTALHGILQTCLTECGLPAEAVQFVSTADRDAVGHLLGMNHWIDLAIPRGGESLIRRVAQDAKMPVLKHYLGNCHVYVDRLVDFDQAEQIIVNAKCQRPAVCNAAESLLVHQDVAEVFLPRVGKVLQGKGVELRGCPRSCQLVAGMTPASDADFAAEFAELILSVKVVRDLEAALEHITQFGSQHTEAILTTDLLAAQRFTAAVDASAVMVNASTRFNDGFEFGLGAEIGISTDKFHARGPCGLQEICSYKYIVLGSGQIRA